MSYISLRIKIIFSVSIILNKKIGGRAEDGAGSEKKGRLSGPLRNT